MPKKVSYSQNAGFIGEAEFSTWASKIGWLPSKYTQDLGIDFVCQILGDRISEKSSEMPGKTLNVSVRSTKANSDTIKIDRDDADLFLNTTSPIVIAIVKRAPHGQAGEVAIKFIDAQFIRELDEFLNSPAKSHTIHFTDAITDPIIINNTLEDLFKEPYMTMIARIRTELCLNEFISEPNAEILYTANGAFAFVHSKKLITQTEVLQNENLKNVLKGIEMNVFFAPSSLLSQQKNGIIGVRSDIRFSTTQDLSTREKSVINGQAQIVDTTMDQILNELSVWNYGNALLLAEELELVIEKEEDIVSLDPELIFLLARVHVIRAERKDSEAKKHIEHVRSLLTQIESMTSPSITSEMKNDVEALKGAIINIESGPEAALIHLDEHDDPYAIRIRLAILMNQKDLDGAIDLIDGLPPNDRWCDLAVTVYTLKDSFKKGEELVKWSAAQKDKSKYPQCVVRLADALLTHSLAGRKEGKNLFPHELSEIERKNITKAFDTLQPILDPIIAKRQIDSDLGATAVKIAWTATYLLGKRESLVELTDLMYTHRPVPIEVARSVVNGLIESPPNIPERLREEHPIDLEANILAAVIQSSYMDQHLEAFDRAKELVPLANTDEKKEELYMLFQHIWQELEGETLSECEKIIGLLVSHNPKLVSFFEVTQALRAQDPDMAIQKLDKEKADDDVNWLQLRANALIQKGELGDAIDLLLIAAKMTHDTVLLHKTADLAMKDEKFDIAAWCYEQLIEIQPYNLLARGNLASIYTFHLHDIGKAETQFRFLHEAEPENPIHTINLALCLAQLYRPKESLSIYNKVCDQEEPDIRAVLGRAEILLSLGRLDVAFASLQDFRQMFWDDSRFLMSFMNIAYAVGEEEAAHEALKAIDILRENGKVESTAFRKIPVDEGLEMLKKEMLNAKEKKEHLHLEMLKGRIPWVLAEQVSANALYWGWRRRTIEMEWIGDAPVNRAYYCIYSTNGFHPRKLENNRVELIPLECPPKGTQVVVDISSLITLHRLGLLDVAADYFGEIVVPEDYLSTVLEDSRQMVLHQRSQQQNAEQILKKTVKGAIIVRPEIYDKNSDIAVIDEYGESKDHCYHMVDLIRPVYNAGVISDTKYNNVSRACTKISGVGETHPEIKQFQDVLVVLSTLETITQLGLLDSITGYFKVHINEEAHIEIQQRLETIQYQEETIKWHFDMWNTIRQNPRFRFVSQILPKELYEKDTDPKEYLSFLGIFNAMKLRIPFLTDDRVCQVFVLNEHSEMLYPAFGTDTLIPALMNVSMLDASETAESILRLMKWRYRFVIPSAEILKVFAEQYRSNPPGQSLQLIAEYIHDCMRDPGLFGGLEKTENRESMAMRLYVSWLKVISQFLVCIWDDEMFSEESAERLTKWSIQELLPSPPQVLHGIMKDRISSLTPKILLMHAFVNTSSILNSQRIPDAIKAIKDALRLSDSDYLKIVTEILNEIQRTKTKP